MDNQRPLTIREAAARTGLKESTLRKWVLQRRIAYCKLGRAIRFPVGVIEKLIRDSYRDEI